MHTFKQGGYCSDCKLSLTLEYGVTSTSTYAATTTWSEELSETVSSSLSFLVASVSKSVTYTVSKEVSSTMNEAFEISVTKSCEATCDSNSGTNYMYQWVLKVEEVLGTDSQPFLVYACDWICADSADIVPTCPLDACSNGNCTVCTPWQTNTTSLLD